MLRASPDAPSLMDAFHQTAGKDPDQVAPVVTSPDVQSESRKENGKTFEAEQQARTGTQSKADRKAEEKLRGNLS